MPTPNIPTKTPLGHDELRSRSRGLSQRYRTVLLLIDGRRPLSEVLSLAQKAGSATSHFEELVRLGLVELPSEAAAPEPVLTEPGVLDTPRLTEVELTVPAHQTAAAADAAPAVVVERAEPVVAQPAVEAEAEPVPVPMPVVSHPPHVPEIRTPPAVVAEAPTMPPPVVARAAAPPAARAPVGEARPHRSRREAAVPPPAPAVAAAPAASPSAPAGPPENPLLQQVRHLLMEALRHDPPPFGSRMLGRLGNAQTLSELGDLTWEIERHLSRAKRSRGGLRNLRRARDLLGLGNTLVAEDSQPGPQDGDE